jgi:hypothetical protein
VAVSLVLTPVSRFGLESTKQIMRVRGRLGVGRDRRGGRAASRSMRWTEGSDNHFKEHPSCAPPPNLFWTMCQHTLDWVVSDGSVVGLVVSVRGSHTEEETMVGRGELTDSAWERIASLLPEEARGSVEEPSRGCERHPVEAQDRRPWRDLLSLYGPWQTCYDRFVRCAGTGPGKGCSLRRRPRATQWAR